MKMKLLIILIVLLMPSVALCDRQADLEAVFDIVDTFDNIQDWAGANSATYVDTNNPTLMPKKLDGSPSIWQRFTSIGLTQEDWICDHGAGYVWGGNKSLCINYSNLADMSNPGVLGYGPSRMSTFFGDGLSGKSGYKKIYIFFMMKIRQGFFIKDELNNWTTINGYVKTHEISSGFTSVSLWGTAEERALTCDTAQVRNEYGLNASVLQFVTAGDYKSIFFLDTKLMANYSDNNCWNYTNAGEAQYYQNSRITDRYPYDEWIGVEIIEDIGTLNNADGTLTINLYDDQGNQTGTSSHTGIPHLVQFDHLYNKVTIGGNKLVSTTTAMENRIYYDDFIINDSEIAPTYFSLLAGSPTYDAPIVEILTESQSTTAETITIIGTLITDSELTGTGVDVNGEEATSSDGFATWSAVVPLSLGSNTITATGTDSNSGTDTDVKTDWITRTTPPSGNVIYTGSMSGGTYR